MILYFVLNGPNISGALSVIFGIGLSIVRPTKFGTGTYGMMKTTKTRNLLCEAVGAQCLISLGTMDGETHENVQVCGWGYGCHMVFGNAIVGETT